MERQPTKVKCKNCLKKKPPVESYMLKQKWGKDNSQYYRLTCSCGFVINDVDQKYLDALEKEELV